MRIIIKYVKKLIFGALVLYTFNMIAVNFNIIIPINIWTVVFVGLFDFPAIVTLILLKLWGA